MVVVAFGVEWHFEAVVKRSGHVVAKASGGFSLGLGCSDLIEEGGLQDR